MPDHCPLNLLALSLLIGDFSWVDCQLGVCTGCFALGEWPRIDYQDAFYNLCYELSAQCFWGQSISLPLQKATTH